MVKRNIYKILLILGFSIYFLFSISVIRGAMITYQSIAYNFFYSGGFFGQGIFNYIRILYYTLYFINLFIIIIIIFIMIINNRYNKKLFASYCIIHFIVCILYYFNYNNILSFIFLIIGCIIPIALSIYLYKKYVENIMKNKDLDII